MIAEVHYNKRHHYIRGIVYLNSIVRVNKNSIRFRTGNTEITIPKNALDVYGLTAENENEIALVEQVKKILHGEE